MFIVIDDLVEMLEPEREREKKTVARVYHGIDRIRITHLNPCK